MQDQDSATAEGRGRMDPRLRRFVARWTCWVLALAIVIVDAVFMGLDWGGKLEVAPGAHGYMLLFAIVLNQAGWEAGRNDTSSGVRYVLGETGDRLAAIETDVAHIKDRADPRNGAASDLIRDAYAAGFVDATEKLARRNGHPLTVVHGERDTER